MPLDISHARQFLQSFNLRKLFIEDMGWDRSGADLEIPSEGDVLLLTGVAQKRGLMVYVCSPLVDGNIPDYATRKKIETQVRKSVHEHLIIFTNLDHTRQVWQWVRREPGKPTTSREFEYSQGQYGEALLQRLQSLAFTLEEEESLGIIDVASRVRATFDLERVTKRFYDRFQVEHDVFIKFLRGIPDETMQRWYISVTLNRLMFIYFIQKKQFLNGDPDYLQNKLFESKMRGKDCFYTDFLCPLFFEGFAKKEGERSKEVNLLLGKIPFLNGGIFAKHQIEELCGQKINIANEAFERLFQFFDQYRWHLDERPLRADNEINPDVLGYIFEKYINQKQMGAYYTKEDITGYISKYTVLPYLLDQARRDCKIAFEGPNAVWKLLQTDPERYIYPAVRSGVISEKGAILPESALPDYVQKGMHDPQARMYDRRYNLGQADIRDEQGKQLTLPTETWREYIQRRQRCLELHQKLANGEVHEANDLITYNLDIQQFVQDVVEASEGPELLRAFWKALKNIKILDPTCGSGAFLFAALSILEPMYEACLERMRVFVAELDQSGEKHRPEKFSDFRESLAQVDQHPNLRYYILKSIIVNNLYGVDIMDEAVDICKLRLFLKLVAQIELAKDIEPLPDIDFNIRAGNTLVGFATRDDVRRAVQMGKLGVVQTEKLFAMPEEESQLKRIEEKAGDVDRLFKLFRQQQTELGSEADPEAKEELKRRLKELDDELNVLLARQYAIHNQKSEEFARWLISHKPFHWFVEFYGIMRKGGFDVIIGNPPYVETRTIEREYTTQEYEVKSCGNLYAMMMERFSNLDRVNSYFGVIVPISIVCTSRISSLRKLLYNKYCDIWFNNYDTIPSTLFSGIVQRNSVVIAQKKVKFFRLNIYTTRLQKWFVNGRETLFQLVPFIQIAPQSSEVTISKISTKIEEQILAKIESQIKPIITNTVRLSNCSINYKRRWSYYLLFADKIKSIIFPDGSIRDQQDVKTLFFKPDLNKYVFISVLSSGLFYFIIVCTRTTDI